MADIKIKNNIQHQIDRNIFGHFIEEIGEAIHDGLWTTSERYKSLPHCDDAFLSGVRTDVLQAMIPLFQQDDKEPGTVLRWPGGNYAETYHWQDGVGKPEDRSGHPNKFWGKFIPYGFFRNKYGVPGPYVHNQFGTDEFNILCRKINARPYINVNYGTGTPEEAADWVEYCNGSPDTKFGALRAKVHPEPYNVKYWGIANEIWGRYIPGWEKRPDSYARRYLEFARAMRQKDPAIRLVASGIDPGWRDILVTRHTRGWNTTLLSAIDGYVDYLSVHIYAPWTNINIINPRVLLGRSLAPWHNEKTHYAMQAIPAEFEKILRRCRQSVEDALGPDTTVRIALDEWNVWYQMSQMIKTNWTLSDSLFVASVLLSMMRLGKIMGMGNCSQLINCLGLIRTDGRGIVKTTSYHAFQMIFSNTYQNYLALDMECPTVMNKKLGMVKDGTIPVLDAGATISDDGKNISLFVVNRHLEQHVNAGISFAGFNDRQFVFKEIMSLTHDDPFGQNTPENRDNIIPRRTSPQGKTPDAFSFPPCSLTVVKLQRVPGT